MHLLPRGHVARTHRAAFFVAAFPDAHASEGGAMETELVVGEAEVGGGFGRVIAGTEPEILVDTIGVDDLAGIHAAIGIPDRLELAKGFDQFGTVHAAQEFGPGLTIAVL